MKIKTGIKTRTRVSGSVLIVCMVLAGIGTVGVAGWISLLDARGHLAEENITGTDRRVRYRNGKTMADYAVKKKFLSGNSLPSSTEAFQLSDGWGEMAISPFTEVALSTTSATRTNKTSSRPFLAFSSDVSVSVSDGKFQYPWQLEMKSFNPMLGGELLTVLPTDEVVSEKTSISGSIQVKGRAVFWGTDYQAAPLSVKAEQFMVPEQNGPAITNQDPGGNPVAPLNYPFVRQTTGYYGGAPSYNGLMSIVDDPGNASNSYAARVKSITSFASISGSYVNLTGSISFANGPGSSTVLPLPNDAVLLAAINNPTIGESILLSQLLGFSPLSSQVLNALIKRNPPVSEAALNSIFSMNYPLPDDVVSALGSQNAPYSTVFKEGIFKKNGSSLVTDGAGGLTVDLSNSNVPHLLLQNFTSLIINGQPDEVSADAMAGDEPRVIVLSNSDNVKLDTVTLRNYNRRRLVLAIKNVGVLDNLNLVDAQGNPNTSGTNHTVFRFEGAQPFTDWRLICELEGINSDIDVSPVQGVTLKGGIRTNHSLNVLGGSMTIEKETDLNSFDSFLARTAWVEAFRVNSSTTP